MTGTGIAEPGAASIVLADGRVLGYAEFGDPDGAPVLYFHGSPASRLEPLLVGDAVLRAHALRVIAPDRPGIGASDFQAGRGFSGWPGDVSALADALRLDRFAVLGNSGGAPYVAVCAARIPERLNAAVVVSGGWRMDWPEARDNLPLVNRTVMALARRAPWLLRAMFAAMPGISEDPERELAKMKQRLPEADCRAFAVPGRVQAFGRVMREAMRQGARGPVWDLGLYVRPFDFDLADVRMPITLFHGEQDTNSPMPLVRRVVSMLPSATLVTFPQEAHLSTLCNRFGDIARALRGAMDADRGALAAAGLRS